VQHLAGWLVPVDLRLGHDCPMLTPETRRLHLPHLADVTGCRDLINGQDLA
jgi:hypothetical protein